jgi:hypothetical protein
LLVPAVTAEPELETSACSCDLCGTSFSSETELLEHFLAVHVSKWQSGDPMQRPGTKRNADASRRDTEAIGHVAVGRRDDPACAATAQRNTAAAEVATAAAAIEGDLGGPARPSTWASMSRVIRKNFLYRNHRHIL